MASFRLPVEEIDRIIAEVREEQFEQHASNMAQRSSTLCFTCGSPLNGAKGELCADCLEDV